MSAINEDPFFPINSNKTDLFSVGITIRDFFATFASKEDVEAILAEGKTSNRQKARFIHAKRMLNKRTEVDE